MISFTADQRFLVTGASSGIGEGVALLLNELGAAVIGIGRNEERLLAMKEKARFPENVFLEQKDLAEDIASLPAYVKQLREKYGKFQGLAYCAGMGGIHPLRAVDLPTLHDIFNINYFAPVFMAKGFADRRSNNGKGSAVVCIASAGGVRCDPGMTAYAGSKGALIATMQSIARELAPAGLRVNCISPTLIETGMAGDIERAYAEGKYPFGLGQVSDVANMVIFLLSEQARWITAQNYILDCGGVI
ncbi:SDR family oxidoreductase [uncultured Mailhella sp.]|uniref:SDR family NAD(P)-dependent oxidoreductase n=1 Tax=uncultured Mailhella sp. TaxID=1981031 RepID=UPI00262FA84E|nr:SDR family oxidoreductase [uncultured Mailhella sp.]